MMKIFKVYIVGAGPGEPDLITVKGLKILEEADVVIYDRLINRRILSYAREEAELISLDDITARSAHSIGKLMVEKAKKGLKVLRLKNGDPFVFGRTTQELKPLLENRIKFCLVPGITAANAASCYSGIPLTCREKASTVLILTGREAKGKKESSINWNKIVQAETIVIYMTVASLNEIVTNLIKAGRPPRTASALIANISNIGQRTIRTTLKRLASKAEEENISPPAIVIIGNVVEYEPDLNWFRKEKKVLFTGLSQERYYEKGLIFHLPMIEIKPCDDYREMDVLIKDLKQFHWILFSSRYGVYYFMERLFKCGKDCRELSGIKIAAIGSSTANKLREYGIKADLIPSRENSQGLLSEFKKIKPKGLKILLPRSDIADKGLTKGLKALGAKVYPCVAYRNVMPKDLPELNFNFFDEIIFTSPSTVRNFMRRYKGIPSSLKVKWIGEVTKEAVERWLKVIKS